MPQSEKRKLIKKIKNSFLLFLSDVTNKNFYFWKNQRPVFPVTEVYNTSALVEHPSQSWSKRSVSKHHQHHINMPQQSLHRHEHKNESQQLSPVKKRVKESTPPNTTRRHSPLLGPWQHQAPPVPVHHSHHQSGSVTNKHQQLQLQEHQQVSYVRQQTITIHDTPSPAVSIITISDSEDESPNKW